jgi:hypothetical protein
LQKFLLIAERKEERKRDRGRVLRKKAACGLKQGRGPEGHRLGLI